MDPSFFLTSAHRPENVGKAVSIKANIRNEQFVSDMYICKRRLYSLHVKISEYD